jgi:hypothetical protein
VGRLYIWVNRARHIVVVRGGGAGGQGVLGLDHSQRVLRPCLDTSQRPCSCLLTGATPACCTGLGAVYADRNSPSYG